MILLLTCLAVKMARQESCDNKYGDCDLGPNCENWNSTTNGPICFDCSDGGYVSHDSECDGVIDCKTEIDEKYCRSKDLQSKGRDCARLNQRCKLDSHCCSKKHFCYWTPGAFAGICMKKRKCKKFQQECYFDSDCCTPYFCWYGAHMLVGFCFDEVPRHNGIPKENEKDEITNGGI